MQTLTPSSTLWDLLKEYRRERNLVPGSVEQIDTPVRHFGRFLYQPLFSPNRSPDARIGDLNKPNLLDWIEWRRGNGIAPSTINSQRAALVSLWSFAADLEIIPPPPRIKRLPEPEESPVAWSLAEFCAILESARALSGEWEGVPRSLCWEIVLGVLWDTAARVSEIFHAELAEIDLEAGRWRVPAAKRKGRRRGKLYKLHPDTVAIIRHSLVEPRQWLIPYPRRATAKKPINTFRDHYKRIICDAGLPTDREHLFHCIRRTSESYAAASKGIKWAAEAVGHGEAVARKSYIAQTIVEPPALIEALPRPAPPRLKVFAG